MTEEQKEKIFQFIIQYGNERQIMGSRLCDDNNKYEEYQCRAEVAFDKVRNYLDEITETA